MERSAGGNDPVFLSAELFVIDTVVEFSSFCRIQELPVKAGGNGAAVHIPDTTGCDA
jgi:hypothetical protein